MWNVLTSRKEPAYIWEILYFFTLFSFFMYKEGHLFVYGLVAWHWRGLEVSWGIDDFELWFGGWV